MSITETVDGAVTEHPISRVPDGCTRLIGYISRALDHGTRLILYISRVPAESTKVIFMQNLFKRFSIVFIIAV